MHRRHHVLQLVPDEVLPTHWTDTACLLWPRTLWFSMLEIPQCRVVELFSPLGITIVWCLSHTLGPGCTGAVNKVVLTPPRVETILLPSISIFETSGRAPRSRSSFGYSSAEAGEQVMRESTVGPITLATVTGLRPCFWPSSTAYT